MSNSNYGHMPVNANNGGGFNQDLAMLDDMGRDEQAYMWQQRHQFEPNLDSGFTSGANSRGPNSTITTAGPGQTSDYMADTDSIINDADSIHSGGGGGGTGSTMGGHYRGGTGPGSIASSAFDLGESQNQSEVSSVHSSQGGHGGQEPDDFIPQLVTALTDEDQYVVDQCLLNVDKFSRKENFLRALVKSDSLIHAITKVLTSSSDALVQLESQRKETSPEFMVICNRAKSAANIMRNMSGSGEGRIAIVKRGGVSHLTKLLGCQVDRVMFIAITTLHNLLLHDETRLRDEAKSHIRATSGVRSMIHLLESRPTELKLLAIVADCLRILAVQDPNTKKVILECGGIRVLVNIMENETYKNLIMMTSRLLKVLSVCSASKKAIIAAGGVDAMAKHLNFNSTQIKSHCIWALRNLSDSVTEVKNLKTLCESLVMVIRTKMCGVSVGAGPVINNESGGGSGSPESHHMMLCAAGIIFNLSCNNETHKLAFCQAGAIQALVAVIRGSKPSPQLQGGHFSSNCKLDILEPAVCALRHLTNNHSRAELAQSVFVQELSGLPVLLGLLRQHMANPSNGNPTPHWPSVKALLGLLRNLSQRVMNQKFLREEGAIDNVRDLIKFLTEGVVTGRFVAQIAVEGVRITEVIEFCLGCIYAMASKDRLNHLTLRDPQLIVVLGHHLLTGAESTQRLSLAILRELSADPAGLILIVQSSVGPGGLGSQSTVPSSSMAVIDIIRQISAMAASNEGGTHTLNSNQQKMVSTAVEIVNLVSQMGFDRSQTQPPQQMMAGGGHHPEMGVGSGPLPHFQQRCSTSATAVLPSSSDQLMSDFGGVNINNPLINGGGLMSAIPNNNMQNSSFGDLALDSSVDTGGALMSPAGGNFSSSFFDDAF